MAAFTVIGQDTQTHQDVALSEEARSLSTYGIGTPGMGKSTLLEHIVEQE